MAHISDLVAESLADLRERNQRCFIEEEFIVFKIDLGDDSSTKYEFPLSDCDTYEKVIGWQLHLSEKQWMTLDLLVQFTLIVCEHHNLSISR